MQSFDSRKEKILEEIKTNDKSVKQSIDIHALPIVELINGMEDYVTTSSCSGRSSILVSNPKKQQQQQYQQQEKGSSWLFISHDVVPVDSEQFYYEITDLFHPEASLDAELSLLLDDEESRMIYFKMEPFIVHIEARDLEVGQRILSSALQAGYRNSGMILSNSDRVMVAIRHTMKLDVPIGFVDDCGRNRLIVPVQYLMFLFKTSNQKLQQNFDRMQILLNKLKHDFCVDTDNIAKCESKEERRQRKRQEGLLKQKQKQELVSENDTVEVEIDFY